jgi:hypothetical protein
MKITFIGTWPFYIFILRCLPEPVMEKAQRMFVNSASGSNYSEAKNSQGANLYWFLLPESAIHSPP